MADAVVNSPVALSLSGGRPAAPGEVITNLDLDAERHHIASGVLVVLSEPEKPEKPAAKRGKTSDPEGPAA